MTPARWLEVKDVVGGALETADGAARAKFLAKACQDDTELLREAESLLAGSLERFESCAEGARLAQEEPSDDAAGRRIGSYRVVRELGRGGMGAVFLAERADDEFQKEVAIKLLKRGTDTDEVLRRFRAEREILARLDHPNIARLLDAGTTDDGLPYFVMEYVSGARVTDYCSAQNLSVPDLLALFLKICGAVQFAHQNLIVHRDLKPANILVTADGEPKLLDFGIAKLLALEDGALQQTIPHEQRLTPAYASPEQVRGEVVTTVSDVYSLGALLYELLTGRSPHRFETTHPPPSALWRVIGESPPARPSQVVDDPRLRRRLRGDLDNILLTALRKEPARRYTGVTAFAEDLRRHLEDRPVAARPITFAYQATKFLSRNKIATAAGAIAVVALLLGTTISLWSADRARKEARRAHLHFEEVRQLANSFLFEFHDAIATLPGATAARQLIVTRALEYLDKLAREAEGDRSLQLELADAYLKVGDVQGRPYFANLGDAAAAARSYGRAAEIASLWAARENGSAESAARHALVRAHVNLAAVQTRGGELTKASQNSAEALNLLQQLLRDAPARSDEWRQLIAACYFGLGDAIQAGNHQRGDLDAYRAALQHYRAALLPAEQLLAAHATSVPDMRRVAKGCARIASILSELGPRINDEAMIEEAFALHARRLRLDEESLRLEPANSSIRRNIADGLIARAYARVLANQGLLQAMEDCERALAIEEPLAAADQSNREAQQDLSYAHYITGRVHQAQGNAAAAAERYRQSIRILEPLVAANPGNVETEFDLERSRRGLAQAAPPVSSGM